MPDKKEFIGSNRLSQILTYIKEKFDGVDTNLSNKVDKVNGKALSTNDFTDAFKTKLEGVASGAEVNVQSDWDETNTSSDAFILHKPESMPASDVYSWAKAANKPSYTFSEITSKPTTISGYGITDAKIANGVITLGSNTITPLTSHQTVTDNNPTLAWGTKSKVATIGSTEINVTMPANPNTNTTYTIATGDANGQIKVTPSSGSAYNVSVKGLGSNAYSSTSYLPLAGGTMIGSITFSGSAAVQYTGTKATYNMIKFKDNTSDTYGNGIIIGGGGLSVIGAGESADTVAAQFSAGDENMHIAADSNVYIYSNVNNGYSSRYTFTFGTDGKLTIPGIANCSYLQTDTNVTYGRNGFQYFNQSTSTTSGAKANANPSSGWYHIIRMNHSNSAGYFVDLAFALNHAASPAYRMISNGSEQGWRTFIDSSNISSQSVNYATSAGSATSATKLGTSTVGGTTTPIYLNAGVPTALGYTISKSVPSDAVFTDHTYNFSGTSFTSNNSTGVNANDVTYNAHTYYTSNGPATSLGASTNDGALFTQAYSTSWVCQIAQDYRNGGLYVRGKNNGTWQSWYRVWDSRSLTNLNQLTNGPGYITSSGSCASATKAYQDWSGNIITSTYSTKAETTIYKGVLTSLGSGTPAAATKTYWENATNTPVNTVNTAYNSSGDEYTIIFSKGATANYGSVLKYGYPSKYIYILRRSNGSWQSTDWEKISAGYADSAGSATSATTAGNVTGTVAVANGGTGATTAANARTNLGLGTAATYTAATSATGSTVVLRDASGYIYCVHVNQSSSDQASSYGASSMLVYCNSDGWFRKAGGFGARYSVTSTWGVGRCANTSYSSANNVLHCWDTTQASIKSEVSGVNMTIVVNNATLYLYSNQTYSWNGAWRPIYASQFSVQSSIQIKKNVEDMSEEEANKLFRLRPVKYDYINEANGTNCYGLIAEEVQDIGVNYPVSIMKDPETQKEMPSLDYSKFVPYLIKVVQMQQEEINELKQKVS